MVLNDDEEDFRRQCPVKTFLLCGSSSLRSDGVVGEPLDPDLINLMMCMPQGRKPESYIPNYDHKSKLDFIWKT